jgi:hypothetical protein
MRIFVVVAIFALAPVTVAIQNQPSGAQERKGTQQASPATPVSVNCNCTNQADDSKNKPQGWHKLVTWPEGIATWALILTLGAIVCQSIETRKAVKAANAQIRMMKDKERARIVVDGPPSKLNLDDGPEWTEGMNVVYSGTKITIENLGGTNAFNVTARAEIIGTPSRGALGSDEVSVLNLPTVLKPNAGPLTEDVITLLKGVDHIAAVKNKSEILHLAGTITYNDIFGDGHQTTFRYLWSVMDDINIGGQGFDASRWEITAEGNRAN